LLTERIYKSRVRSKEQPEQFLQLRGAGLRVQTSRFIPVPNTFLLTAICHLHCKILRNVSGKNGKTRDAVGKDEKGIIRNSGYSTQKYIA